MNGRYLINAVEKYSKETGVEVGKVYEMLGTLYQANYGVNIVVEMQDKGQFDIVSYLESKGKGFIDRYVIMLNIARRCGQR